jgi:hypothetical protein
LIFEAIELSETAVALEVLDAQPWEQTFQNYGPGDPVNIRAFTIGTPCFFSGR